jgi:NADPH:quinone reductase-like Zn-dependent oxidoreductase
MISEHSVPATVTMQAIVQDRYGDAGVLRHERIALPEIADNELLVCVRGAGLDRGTWHLMTGKPYLMRIAGMGFRGPKDRVPGRDLAARSRRSGPR